MKKLLRASILASAILLLFLAAPSFSYAKGTSAVEQVILTTKVVPEAEVTRITENVGLCGGGIGSEVSNGTDINCEETYPLGTRVNITGSAGKRVITIRDNKNNLLTAETGLGATSVVRAPDEAKVAERANPGGSDRCDIGNIGQCFLNLPGMLMSAIGFLLLTLSGLLLGVAGVVFNWVVIRTVFQFALYFGTSPGMLVAWGVLRDIANIALLFGFIFMGIATILNTQSMEGYTAKKALPRLIIFAVLLNFSLFATQAIIDVSNGFSSVFASYAGEQCDTTTSTAGSSSGDTNQECSNVGISGKIISAAGLSKVFPSGFSESFDKPYTYAVMLIILSLLVTVAAMVLFAAAIMLVIRVVVLSLLMVTSPIGFAGMAIPALHKISQDWWHKLINQAFFAPLYLLMIFISLKLVDGLQEGNTSIADALMGNTASSASVATATTTAGNMQVIVVFIIVIGFMVAALMVAQKMGAYGAGFATKTAAGLTFGAHGFVARRTVGRASGKIAESIRKSDFGHTEAGRFMAGFADKGAKASFDLRGNKVAGKVGGLNLGSAQKGGYDAIVHHGQEAREKYAKTLRQTDADKKAENDLKEKKEGLEKNKTVSAETLDIKKKDTQKKIAEAESINRAAATERADARKIQEAKLGAALARGDAALAATEEAALKNMTANHRTAVATEEAGIKALRDDLETAETEHKESVKAIDASVKAIDAQIKGDASKEHNIIVGVGSNSAQYRYAKNLHDTSKSVVNLATAGGVANHHAASSIIKNAGKSKIEKALADIKEATDKPAHDDHASEESHAAPAAHAPAAGGGHGDKH